MKFDVVTLAVLIVTIQFASCARESCGDVRRTFVTRSVGPATMVPIMPVTGVGLAVCRSEGPTCCTPAMEAKYREASARDLTDLVKQKTAPLEKRFRIFAKKFREFWNQVVKSSRSRAITAQQNPDLESELRHFYDSFLMPNPVRLASNDDRHVQLDGLLYTVFISSLEDEIGFKLSEEKMGCALSELTRYLTPLTSLKAEIEALLNRTGLFFKALNVGLRAAELYGRISTGGPCVDGITKMRYCSHCYGYTLIKTCPGLCRNVVRGCLVGMSELDMFWKYYIVSMNNIANKLGNDEGEVGVYFHRIFNSISTIVRTITDKQYSLTIRNQCDINSDRSKRSLDRLPISDASELNERKNSDTSRPHRRRRHRHRTEREQEMRSSFRRRGRQARGRKHRNVELKPGSVDHPKEVGKQRIRPPFELLLEEAPLPHKPLAFEQMKKNEAEIIVDEEIPVNVEFNPGTPIKRFADELNTTKDFFATFADDLCSSSQPVAFQVSNYGFCWNGEKMAETYDKPIPDNGIEGQFLNPEVKVVTLKREVQTVIEDLRKISKEILETVADIDLPAPIMHSPFYVTPDLSISEIPCDDEDDCFDVEGSAEQSGQEPAQPKGKLATPMYEPFPIEKTDVYFKPVITEDRPVLTTVRPFVNKSESSAKVPLLEQKDGNAKNITVSTLILSGDGRGVASRLFSRKLVELFLFAFFAMFIAQRE